MLHPRWILGLWIMAALSLCGGDDSCQSLLALNPPEVVGVLGEAVLVNCTTTEEYPDAMFWTYDGTESDHDDKSFFLSELTLSKWDMTAKCTLKLNDTFECHKDLKITVYKIPTLKLLSPYPMYDGHDYELKCKVMSVAPVQNLRVIWSTENQTLRTQTFNESSATPVNVTSTLNITADRKRNGELLKCEVELDLAPLEPMFQPAMPALVMDLDFLYPPVIQHCPGEVTAVEQMFKLDELHCYADGNPEVTRQWYFGSDLVNASELLTRGRSGTYTAVFANTIGVIETSVKVTVEYPPEVWRDIEELIVDQGVNVSLACDAEGIPLFFNWTCNGQNMNVSASVLNVSHVMTNRSCTCAAHNYLGAASKTIHLHVVTPQQPSVPLAVATPEPAAADAGCPIRLMPAEVAVRFGEPVTINCTSSASVILGILWEVPAGEVKLVDAVATWSVRQMTEWRGAARCILNLGDRLCSKVPNITLYKPPDNVLVRVPDVMLEDVDYQLTCDIISVAPVQKLKVKWLYRLETMETQTFNMTDTTLVTVSSVINVTAKARYNGGSFRCEAELDLGPRGPKPPPVIGEAPAVVHYPPVFRACPETFSGMENVVNLDMVPCKPDGNPAASVQWTHEGKVINASEPLSRTRSGTYVAKAENPMGSSTVTFNIAVEHEPSLSCKASYEVAENDVLQTVCEPGGLPSPVVSWIRDGTELSSSRQWKKEDGGNYLLRATNKHGAAEHELHVDVLYAPRFSKGNSTVLVSPGGNVILECSADANPSPDIQWIFQPAANVVNTTGWRRSVLTVNEATSTNAGVYICVATNKVGSVSRFDTLRMKDQSSSLLPGVFWGLMILLVVVMIIGLIVCFASCKTRSKHRRYSFVPSTSRNDSERSYPLNELPEWKRN